MTESHRTEPGPDESDPSPLTTSTELQERNRLVTLLDELHIRATIVPYPAHRSIEEGKQLRGDMAGVFTKNLLLRDKKSGLFFITAHEDTVIALKTLHTTIGARGRLSFASSDIMADRLHIHPGTATPLALVNDTERAITLIVDEQLVDAEQLNFHPMVHTESIGLSWSGFIKFADSTGHPPQIVDLR